MEHVFFFFFQRREMTGDLSSQGPTAKQVSLQRNPQLCVGLKMYAELEHRKTMYNINMLKFNNFFLPCAVNIPQQPDWLFQRPYLTLDFIVPSEMTTNAVSYTVL